jgi:hypothetical protein
MEGEEKGVKDKVVLQITFREQKELFGVKNNKEGG